MNNNTQHSFHMNRSQNTHPLGAISGNVVAKPSPAGRKPSVDAASPMDTRFGLFEDEPLENVTYELPDAHSSDSSYDLRILEEMRTQREAQYARRRQHSRSSETTPGRTPGKLTPGISQRLTTNAPRNVARLPLIQSDTEDNDTETVLGQPAQYNAGGPLLMRLLRNVPVQKDPHITITKPVARRSEEQDSFMRAAEDSPLSRKSSARGTPASVQGRRSMSMNKSDSWDLTADLKDHLGFESTPAPYRNRRPLHLHDSDGDDETEDYAMRFDMNRVKSEKPPEQKGLSKLSSREQETRQPREQTSGRQTVSSQPASASSPQPMDSMDVLKRLSRSVNSTSSPRVEPVPFPDRKRDSVSRSSRLAIKPEVDASESKFASALDSPSRSSAFLLSNSQSYQPEFSPLGRDRSSPSNAETKKAHSPISKPSSMKPFALVPDTPLVTGAFLRTPIAVKPKSDANPLRDQRTSPPRTSNVKLDSAPTPNRELESSSTLPKSAISSIVQRAKSNSLGSQASNDAIGEITMNSLEDIMEVTSDDNVTNDGNDTTDTLNLRFSLEGNDLPTEEDKSALRELLEHRLATELPFSQGLPPSVEEQRLIRQIVDQRLARTIKARAKKQPKPKAAPTKQEDEQKQTRSWPTLSLLTPRKKGRMEEELQLQKMSDHVNTMHSRTRELKAGISRLEKKMFHGPPDETNAHSVEDRVKAHSLLNLSQVIRSLTSVFWQTDEDGQGQLTWLGLSLVVSALWLIAEMVLWFVSCPPSD
jgi:hypothetical protein